MCQLCGKNKGLFVRTYRYDNGESFTALVCKNCADLHARLSKAAK